MHRICSWQEDSQLNESIYNVHVATCVKVLQPHKQMVTYKPHIKRAKAKRGRYDLMLISQDNMNILMRKYVGKKKALIISEQQSSDTWNHHVSQWLFSRKPILSKTETNRKSINDTLRRSLCFWHLSWGNCCITLSPPAGPEHLLEFHETDIAKKKKFQP